MKLYVEKVLPQGHISYLPAPIDPIPKSVAAGDRDKIRQDALYVRLCKRELHMKMIGRRDGI
jgi:hypothetical protein